MPQSVELEGTVWGVFAHRFALETRDGKVLADLGPHARDTISLREGDRVRLGGERKPSEIKVSRLVTPDGTTHEIGWPPKHEHAPADPRRAIDAAVAQGYAITGEPRRKPKHWELPARRDDRPFELHVELDGRIRKAKELAA